MGKKRKFKNLDVVLLSVFVSMGLLLPSLGQGEENIRVVKETTVGGEFKADRRYSLYGIDVDEEGKVYVGNFRHGSVIIYDKDLNELSRINAPTPHGVTVDKEGSIYVSTYGTGRVFKFDSYGNEIPNWDGRLRSQNKLKTPCTAVIDDENNIIIAEYGLGKILKVDSNGNLLKEFDVSVPRSRGEFLPHGIATDGKEYVYVAARVPHASIDVFTLDGQYVKTWQPLGEPNDPLQLSFLNDRLILVPNYKNRLIDVFTREGEHLTSFGPSGDKTEKFFAVTDVAIDKEGFGYVVEQDSNRIQKFDFRNLAKQY